MFCFFLSRKLNTISNTISGEYLNMSIDLSSCAFSLKKKNILIEHKICYDWDRKNKSTMYNFFFKENKQCTT